MPIFSKPNIRFRWPATRLRRFVTAQSLQTTLFLAFITTGTLSFMANAIWSMWQSYPILYLLPASLLGISLLLHAYNNLGLTYGIVFFLISALIAALAEYLAITYQPFGAYEFRLTGAWRIGKVPLNVLLAWSIFIYIGYALSNNWLWLLGKNKPNISNKDWGVLFLLTFSDAFLITGIDLMLDPVQQFEKNWIWKEGGAFFGAPYGNFLGWFVVVGGSTLIFRSIEYFYLSTNKKMEKNAWIPTLTYLLITGFYLYAAQKYFGWNLSWIGGLVCLPIPLFFLYKIVFQKRSKAELS